jgi:hypothetical protein
MSDDQTRADEFCKRLASPPRTARPRQKDVSVPRDAEAAAELTRESPERETESKREEERLSDRVGKAPGPQRGDET